MKARDRKPPLGARTGYDLTASTVVESTLVSSGSPSFSLNDLASRTAESSGETRGHVSLSESIKAMLLGRDASPTDVAVVAPVVRVRTVSEDATPIAVVHVRGSESVRRRSSAPDSHDDISLVVLPADHTDSPRTGSAFLRPAPLIREEEKEEENDVETDIVARETGVVEAESTVATVAHVEVAHVEAAHVVEAVETAVATEVETVPVSAIPHEDVGVGTSVFNNEAGGRCPTRSAQDLLLSGAGHPRTCLSLLGSSRPKSAPALYPGIDRVGPGGELKTSVLPQVVKTVMDDGTLTRSTFDIVNEVVSAVHDDRTPFETVHAVRPPAPRLPDLGNVPIVMPLLYNGQVVHSLIFPHGQMQGQMQFATQAQFATQGQMQFSTSVATVPAPETTPVAPSARTPLVLAGRSALRLDDIATLASSQSDTEKPSKQPFQQPLQPLQPKLFDDVNANANAVNFANANFVFSVRSSEDVKAFERRLARLRDAAVDLPRDELLKAFRSVIDASRTAFALLEREREKEKERAAVAERQADALRRTLERSLARNKTLSAKLEEYAARIKAFKREREREERAREERAR